MGIFSNVGDVSGQLKDEGLNVVVNWQPGVPNVGQGTISWNIPGPVVESVDDAGNITVTSSASGPGLVYGGIVFVLKNSPMNESNIPKNGVVYLADPTADPDMFSGDRIGDGLVVGAIYESEVKAQGGTLTTSIVINDIQADVPYFICGYIHDDENRYYQEGNRTYSEKYALQSGHGSPGNQVIELRQIPGLNTSYASNNQPPQAPQPAKFGVKPTDGTGLIAGATYQFELIYDDNFPHPTEHSVKKMFFSFDGSLAPTYAQLLSYINQQIAIKCTNAVQSPVPPGAGTYYWDAATQTLYVWNGMTLTVVPCVVQATDPAMPAVGSYWWNTTNNMLYMWNGISYVLVQPQYAFPTDPTQIQGDAYWWNGVDGFYRCGNTWCEATTYNQTTDPSCPPTPVDCAYWYDTANSTLYNWSGVNWVQAYALMWTSAPNELPNGTLWFNLENNELSVRESNGPIATFQTPQPGTGYVQGTYNNVPLIGGHGIGATANIVVSNTVSTVGNIVGGSLYNNNIDREFYAVPLTGGTGAGATANITVVSGTVIAVQIVSGGVGYTLNDTLTTPNTNLGGTGSGFSCQVNSVSGGVQSVTLVTPGTGYLIGDALSAVSTSLGSATGSGFVVQVATLAPTATNEWIQQAVFVSTVDPTTVSGDTVIPGSYWYNPTTEILNQRDVTNTIWNPVPVLVWAGDPTVVASCELWWDEATTPASLFQWDFAHSTWNPVSAFYQQATDPYGTPTLATGTLWWNPNTMTLLVWNGSSWSTTNFFTTPFDPTMPPVGTAWLNTTTNTWYIYGTPNPGWNAITPVVSATNPAEPAQGSFWFDTANNVLYTRVGNMWVPVPYVTTPPVNMKGQTWYNLATGMLMEWNGSAWVPTRPCVHARLDRGQIVFETSGRGSKYVCLIPIPAGIPNQPSTCVTINTGQADYVNDSNSPYDNIPLGGQYLAYPLGGFGNSYNCFCAFQPLGGSTAVRYNALPINPAGWLWANLKPKGALLVPRQGHDGVDGTPTYDQLGVGTTGDPGPRRQMMKEVRALLGDSGSEVITVELDNIAMDLAVNNALREFRRKSSLGVKRAAFFLDIVPYKQNYILSDKAVGFNKIVNVMAGYRFTAAFLASAMGAGVYGQIVLQHLYNMGTFDLLSYHVVSQYVEQLEILFSTRLVFVFDQASRELQIFEAFNRPERILLDATIEKTEQEIFMDRFAHRWIQQFALAEACDMLANIRGKYGNLPGAGGSVTLNASDLRSQASDIRTRCQEEIDDYTVQNVEDFGAYGSIAIG